MASSMFWRRVTRSSPLNAAPVKRSGRIPDPGTEIITNRGINYWESRGPVRPASALCQQSFSARHRCPYRPLDPVIRRYGGRSISSKGSAAIRETCSWCNPRRPGRVFEDLLILGSATNQGYGSAPGDIRAFDVRTGRLVWTFHTIPHPGEFGYETWPKDAWKRVGGANVWSELSLDEKRGIVYVPTASAKYNFYGADRTGANLFADCLLALDARTGKRLWHFQMVHHDIWDYDDATAPKLLTVRHDRQTVDVVAQVSKQGFVWVFDRVTGAPLWPIEERPVPRSDMPGEETWPTQPFPTQPPPFARQKFTVDDLSPYLSPEDRAKFRDEILSARNEGLFTPPGRRPTIQMPGNNGGANWGGAAVDPASGSLFVVSKDLPSLLRLAPDPEADKLLALAPAERYYSGFGFMTASNGLSPIAPPWTSSDRIRPEPGDHQMEDPAGGCARAGGKRDRQHRRAFPESRTGGDGGGPDLHWHARSQSSCHRRRNRARAVGTSARRWARRDARSLRSRRPRVRCLLRCGAGRTDAEHQVTNPRRICRLRSASRELTREVTRGNSVGFQVSAGIWDAVRTYRINVGACAHIGGEYDK